MSYLRNCLRYIHDPISKMSYCQAKLTVVKNYAHKTTHKAQCLKLKIINQRFKPLFDFDKLTFDLGPHDHEQDSSVPLSGCTMSTCQFTCCTHKSNRQAEPEVFEPTVHWYRWRMNHTSFVIL